ncbi:MAG: YebC/PmpR family DNA-binding transcriptional regulator [Pseudomonadota bacterium]
MAGHSKWANIKHKKAANDKKRGKLWSKLIKEVTVAARQGGGDISANPRLRLAVDKAKAGNMPNDTIDRAVKRGAGGEDTGNFDEIRYEGYAPGGIAVLVDCLTDNRNRTASEVRHAFTKHGGNLGTDGSVAYLFQKQGILSYAPGANEEALLELALELGAEDVVKHDDDSVDVYTSAEEFHAVHDGLTAADQVPDHAEIAFTAETQISLEGEAAEKVLRLIDFLEDLDDVQSVYTNADLAD